MLSAELGLEPHFGETSLPPKHIILFGRLNDKLYRYVLLIQTAIALPCAEVPMPVRLQTLTSDLLCVTLNNRALLRTELRIRDPMRPCRPHRRLLIIQLKVSTRLETGQCNPTCKPIHHSKRLAVLALPCFRRVRQRSHSHTVPLSLIISGCNLPKTPAKLLKKRGRLLKLKIEIAMQL